MVGIVEYLKIRVSQDERKDVKDYSIQLAGIALAALAIVFSISSSAPNPALITSFSLAIFLLFLTYVMISYFESYGSLIVEEVLFIAGIEVLILGVIDFAYPTLEGFSIAGVDVGLATVGVGMVAAFMLAIVLAMQIRDVSRTIRGM